MLLKLALYASRRGWSRLSTALLELDLITSGLGSASRRIRRDQKRRQRQPRADLSIELGRG